jgi:hypothetical protein
MKLTICSLCLRVQRGKSWVNAEQVIHELRSYERSDLPHLRDAVCDDCVDTILRRRAEAEQPLAA